MNPVIEIINNDVVALSIPDGTGKWNGVIAYSEDHPSRAREAILTIPFMYMSARDAEIAMDAEVVAIRQFAADLEEK